MSSNQCLRNPLWLRGPHHSRGATPRSINLNHSRRARPYSIQRSRGTCVRTIPIRMGHSWSQNLRRRVLSTPIQANSLSWGRPQVDGDMQPFAMSSHQPLPKLTWASHLLWLVRDLQASSLRIRLGRAGPLEGTGSSLRFLSLLRLWNSMVRSVGSGPTRRRRSLKIGGRNPEHLRKCLLRLLLLLLFLPGQGTSRWRRVTSFLTRCFP